MGESFWQNNNLVTHILFELDHIIFSPVENFGDQSLVIRFIYFGKSLLFCAFIHTVCLLDTPDYAGGMKSISDKGCVPQNQKNNNSRGNRRLKKQGQ